MRIFGLKRWEWFGFFLILAIAAAIVVCYLNMLGFFLIAVIIGSVLLAWWLSHKDGSENDQD